MSERLSEIHLDPTQFREAVSFTAAETGFAPRLIEKDYFCSLVLHDFAPIYEAGYVFKGGTCLSKVHAQFYRISEDLDFCFPTDPDASRRNRRNNSKKFRSHFQDIPKRLAEFSIGDAMKGNNDSRQYSGRICYQSLISSDIEPIKIELSLRELLVEETEKLEARTVLMNPISGEKVAAHYAVDVMSLHETFAEKTRAALTRRSPEIRDFFDLWHALQHQLINFSDTRFLELVRTKLELPGTGRLFTSDELQTHLALQLETRLKPVLSQGDYTKFELKSILSVIENIRKALSL